MKLWVDDIRNAPDPSWTVARTITEAIHILSMFDPEEVSLDHDISHQVSMDGNSRPYPCPETFASVAFFIASKYWQHLDVDSSRIVSTGLFPKITIHTANPVGAENIKKILSERGIESTIKSMRIVNRLEMESKP